MSGSKQTALQRKIFTRWINQKFAPHKLAPINDCVEDFADGFKLVKLIEVLSETTFKGKLAPQTMRMKQMDQATRALKYTWDSGVDLKIKPSSENLVDKNERDVLALVWGIMLRYLKFSDDDDEEKLSAEDALLMWVNNQVQHVGLKVAGFKKGFRDGKAFCAIMNKSRPKIVNYDEVKDDAAANLNKAFDAANKCFGLEKYLETSDVAMLDNKSMMIYVAEYYIGAADMRKTDLAVRRVTKLVNYTRTNDAMKKEYNETAKPLRERVDSVLARLNEHTIDNTMAGARQNLEDFAAYKTTEKGKNSGDFLQLESIFNNLGFRLIDHHRPKFEPGQGLDPAAFAKVFEKIEEAEQKKNKALHDEMNRQIRLANIYEQHKTRRAKLSTWSALKLAYVTTKEEIDSSGQAKYHLNRFAAYESEVKSTKARSWESLQKQGAELVSEKCEHTAAVQESESAIAAVLSQMVDAGVNKQAVLDDDLARELYKEKINLVAEEHGTRYSTLEGWIQTKLAYTAKKEDISSVSAAQLQLSLLAAYESNKTDLSKTAVPSLKELGSVVNTSEYKTDLSQWEYPDKAGIQTRETYVDESWSTLASQSAEKLAILNDDLAREKFKEEIRLGNMEHVDRHTKLMAWAKVKAEYLEVREAIDTVDKAQVAVSTLGSYVNDNTDVSNTSLPAFKSLGQHIITAEYKTELSQWVSPDIPAVQARESETDDQWTALAKAADDKKAFLDAELARELKKEELRLQIANLGGDFMLWSTTALEDVKASHFGFLLEEVEAYGPVMSAEDAKIASDGSSKMEAYTAVHTEAEAIGVKDNRYTTLSLSDLASSHTTLTAAVAVRKEAYGVELARQRANDALDREFSTLVDGLDKDIHTYRAQVATATVELKEQETFVAERLADTAQSAQLPKVAELNAKIKTAEFAVRHTTTSELDITIAWENYQVFLKAKLKSIQEESLHKELQGVSLEEYKDIENQFKQFDKNSNGILDHKEFKACLYSLGEEIPKKEVLAIMEKHGGDKENIVYDGFKSFMISQLGDTDTTEEIISGFALMNNGAEVAKVDLLMELLKDEDVDWFKGEAPACGPDYDYKAFTNQVFAR